MGEEMSKMTREQKVEVIARNFCKLVGIEEVDSTDGSANWFMFANDAEKLITDFESRGFRIFEWVELKDSEETKHDANRSDLG